MIHKLAKKKNIHCSCMHNSLIPAKVDTCVNIFNQLHVFSTSVESHSGQQWSAATTS